jgi:hypothetical protein
VQGGEARLPLYPGRSAGSSRGERDYLGFRFECVSEGDSDELNSLLDVMRAATLCR